MSNVKIKSIYLKLLIIFFLLFFSFKPIYSQVCTNEEDCQQKKKEYEQKLTEIRQQKNTLSAQIQYMDTQIYLTTIKIQQTEYNIKKITEEIENLTGKIDNLNTSLNYLGTTFIKKIVEGYKRRQMNFFDVFLDSKNASMLVNRIKYIKIAQDNDRRLAFQVQQAKVNFEEQKKLREEKKKQLDQLRSTLNNQKIELDNQKSAKQRLLEITKNDENTYQGLLEEAQKQLASFKSFVKAAGGGTISANGFGAGSDGWYYSQRDERWANKTIGSSNEIVLEVGCLITDIAMIMKKNGVDWTPLNIASNSNYFFANTAYMLVPSRFSWPNGLSYVNISTSSINEEIDNDHPVIAGLYAGKYGTHYVVLKQVDGDDYVIHDPYYGPDKKFSEYYSKSSIFVAGVFK
jgi:peptidoglycan hydrolase CwlO-like protein